MFKAIIVGCALAGSCLMGQSLPERLEDLQFKPLPFEMPRAKGFKAKLQNGIPVYIFAEPDGVPFVNLRILVKGGNYLDPKGKAGLANICATELRDGGTEKVPADELDDRLDFMAWSVNSSFSGTFCGVSMSVLEKDLKEGMDLFMQVLTHPAFDQQRLTQLKESTKLSLVSRNDSAGGIAGYQINYLLNGENHFSTAPITPSSLDAITREDLKAFHTQVFMDPANLTVVVTGRFQKQQMLAFLDKHLGQMKAVPGSQPSPNPSASGFQRKPGIYLVEKDVPQSTVQMVLPGLRRSDSDWYAAGVMNEILGGGGFTARLSKKIRSDEGLTYGIGSGFGEGALWKGDWTCGFQTKNRSVAYALRLVFAEMDRIQNELVPDEELKSIKDAIVAAFPSAWSNRKSLPGYYAGEFLAGWPEDWAVSYREKVAAVTAEDVRRVARKYLDRGQLVLLVVGNLKEVEAGDGKDSVDSLVKTTGLPLGRLPLRDPLTMKPLN